MSDDTLWDIVKQTVTPIDRSDVWHEDADANPFVRGVKPTLAKPTKSNVKDEKIIPTTKSATPIDIDRKTWRQIDKGRLKVDDKFDLHGLTVAQAHQQFKRIIKQSVKMGKKCIIVVTGKGSAEKGTGVIRRELPHWAEQGDMARYIHAISEPSKNRGRYIVILRRQDKIT